jgi:hypothetical protein
MTVDQYCAWLESVEMGYPDEMEVSLYSISYSHITAMNGNTSLAQ